MDGLENLGVNTSLSYIPPPALLHLFCFASLGIGAAVGFFAFRRISTFSSSPSEFYSASYSSPPEFFFTSFSSPPEFSLTFSSSPL
eukprot:6193415-Pleurochrysis_carterae.AAC.2